MEVAISLGSNLGNRVSLLKEARDRLASLSSPGSTLTQAPIYQSAPVDCKDDSPDFFNTVVIIEYEGTPEDLLQSCKQIEKDFGRLLDSRTGERHAPRPIDLDILYFGEERLDTPDLEIPHPRMLKRLFVLKPLSDIRPYHTLPGDIVIIDDHLKHLDSGEPPLTLIQASW